MPEEQLSKTGKRGGYESESPVNLELSADGTYWIARKQPKPEALAKVDNQRAKLNKELKERRTELVAEIKRREPKTSSKEATDMANFQIYGEAKGKRKPKTFRFSSEGRQGWSGSTAIQRTDTAGQPKPTA